MSTSRARAISRISGSDKTLGSTLTLSDRLTADEPAPLTADLDAGDGDGGVRQSGMLQVSFNIAAEVMGAGVLSLPHAVVALGWVAGLGATAVFALCSLYAGLLLRVTITELFPNAESFADLAVATVGPRFGTTTRFTILLSWALLLPYFVIASASSLRLAFPQADGLCFPEWCCVAALLLLLPLQCQTLHTLSYAALLSTLAIIAAAVLVLATLSPPVSPPVSPPPPTSSPLSFFAPTIDAPSASLDAPSLSTPMTLPVAHSAIHSSTFASANHSLWPPALESPRDLSFADVLAWAGSVCAFVFAFQGQSVFPEMMREMRDPREFGYSIAIATAIMSLVYSATVIIGYGAMGSSVAGFLPDSMAAGPAKRIVGVLITLHTTVCYLITGQPLHRAAHSWLFPRDAASRWRSSRPASIGPWLITTLMMLLFAVLLATLVPFFAQFQSLLGALTGTPSLYGWPPLFYLRGCALRGRRVPALDRFMCNLFLWVLLPVLSAMGTADAVTGIVRHWRAVSNPLAGCSL